MVDTNPSYKPESGKKNSPKKETPPTATAIVEETPPSTTAIVTGIEKLEIKTHVPADDSDDEMLIRELLQEIKEEVVKVRPNSRPK